MRNHIIEIPVRIRSMAIPTDKATPMESPFRMDLEVMEPLETSSTCLVNTCTAGSAFTIKKPISIPIGISRKLRLLSPMEAPRY